MYINVLFGCLFFNVQGCWVRVCKSDLNRQAEENENVQMTTGEVTTWSQHFLMQEIRHEPQSVWSPVPTNNGISTMLSGGFYCHSLQSPVTVEESFD